jgi:DtxR family transcriptional regulator, Mn-dependent transcriptional regulator
MSESIDEYLEAIYVLSREGQAVGTNELSRHLDIKPASATEMLKKLAQKGYIEYSPYQGVTLTGAGFQYGRKMVRKHRLLERFLHDVLKIGNDRVHKYACEMEHSLSDDVERSICQTLKKSDTCPDDAQTIPPCDFQFATCQECRNTETQDLADQERRKENLVSLCSMAESKAGKIVFIRGGRQMVQRLLDMGLTPGSRVKMLRSAPFRGPVEIEVRGSHLMLGQQIASKIFVEKGP